MYARRENMEGGKGVPVSGYVINMKHFFPAHVHGFNAHWKPRRPFAIDMAGFAVRLSLIFANPGVAFTYESPRGFLVYIVTYISSISIT